MGSGNQSEYRPDIDGLRTVAVLAVVLFHMGIASFSGGFVGVDVFFVISGFLITRILRRDILSGGFSFSDFYLRRARRLFPALIATIAVTYVIGFFVYSPYLFRDLSESVFYAVLSMANIYFWLQAGYFDSSAISKPLLHMWSLGVEEQFYLFWPLFLFILLRRRSQIFTISVLALVSILSFAMGLSIEDGIARNFLPEYLRVDPDAAFYLTPFRVFQFGIGGMLAWVMEWRRLPNIINEFLLSLGLAMIVASVFLYDEGTAFPSWASLLPSGGAFLVILAGQANYTGLLLRCAPSVSIGRLSYSLYLVHWPIVVFFVQFTGELPSLIEIPALFAVMLLASYLLNRFVEERFRRRSTASLSGTSLASTIRRPDFGFGLVASLLSILIIFFAVQSWTQNGWVWRLKDQSLVAQLDVSKPFRVAHYGGRSCEPPKCILRAEFPQKILMLGDSHIRHYFEGLKTVLTSHSIEMYTRPGCSFFSKNYVRKNKLTNRNCLRARRAGFDSLAAPFEKVVISLNWAGGSYENGVFSIEGREHLTFDGPKDFAEFVSKEIAELVGDTLPKRVVVIGNVPTFRGHGSSPEDCAFPPFGIKPKCQSTPKNSRAIKERQEINLELQRSLTGIAVFINPFDYLCDDEECQNLLDGYPVYSDNTHLSDRGSIFMVKEIESLLLDKDI